MRSAREKKFIEYESRNEKTCFLHICDNKGADQLRGKKNGAADQRLCVGPGRNPQELVFS